MNSITITIPELPSAALKSGFRGGWWKIRKAKSSQSELAYVYSLIAIREKNGKARIKLPLRKTEVDVVFVFASRRRRDIDNFTGMLKAFLDGIVKSGIIEDDCSEIVTSIKVKFEVDKARSPLTIITLREVSDDNQ